MHARGGVSLTTRAGGGLDGVVMITLLSRRSEGWDLEKCSQRCQTCREISGKYQARHPPSRAFRGRHKGNIKNSAGKRHNKNNDRLAWTFADFSRRCLLWSDELGCENKLWSWDEGLSEDTRLWGVWRERLSVWSWNEGVRRKKRGAAPASLATGEESRGTRWKASWEETTPGRREDRLTQGVVPAWGNRAILCNVSASSETLY